VEDVREHPGGDGGLGECPPEKIIVDPRLGVRICSEGGYVIDEHIIDGSPEWRQFSSSDVKGLIRASHMPTYARHDGFTPSLTIKPKGEAWKDYRRGIRFHGRRRTQLQQRYGTRRSDRPLIDMLVKSQDLARAVGISSKRVIDNVGWIIHKYYESRRREGEEKKRPIVINEREKWAVAVVALKKVIQAHNFPIAENELYNALAELTDQQTAESVRNYAWKVLVKMNSYGIKAGSLNVRSFGGLTPGNGKISMENRRAITRIAPYVQRLVKELGLPPYIAEKAIGFVRSVVRTHPGKSLSGRKPEAIAAAAVYFVARIYDYDEITQARVAEVFNLSEANVRKALRYLLRDIVVVVGL